MSRIERLAKLLQEDPVLVAGPPYVLGGQANVRYLTGLQSSNSAVLVEPDGKATLYTDFRYANRARKLEGVEVVETARGLIPAVGELLAGRRILFEEQHLPYALYRALADAGVDAVPSSGLVEGLRAVKDDEEIAAMRRAGALTRRDLRGAREGARSPDAANGSSRGGSSGSFREAGAEGIVLRAHRRRRRDGIVSARGPGRRADRAGRARHDRRRLRRRRLLLRLHAHLRGRARCRPDWPSSTRCASRRSWPGSRPSLRASTAATPTPRRAPLIDAAGLGAAYGHGLGHGVGLQIHEAPTLRPESTDVLEAGNVVSVEPGIYLPDEGAGVRIEDLVLVTGGGCERLTQFAKELRRRVD